MRNITNTGNKGIPDHICFCAMTISLELRGPTHISTVYRVPGQNHTCKFPCMWLVRAFRGAACDSAWEKGAELQTFVFRALSEQAPEKYRLAPSSISAGILLSRGWGPGANYSCAVLPQPKEGHLVRSYGPVVDKPLRGGDWTGVLSSNDACGLSHSHPKWWPASAWPGREEIIIETTAIRE
ncbi:hypothetical protein BVC80_2183g1 [Macleaya cordata]|uniref:Uncharacterized protein n=1 Tax=Macleaya cordata TaxID=56857 RepID=A0A200QY96_MACCD|nr:hypothetical protein BVC80_2183g1 [Macleaya cordata]